MKQRRAFEGPPQLCYLVSGLWSLNNPGSGYWDTTFNITNFTKFLYKSADSAKIETVQEMGHRLMAGQQTLNLHVEVRLLLPQQSQKSGERRVESGAKYSKLHSSLPAFLCNTVD